jgi:hypothetical protein
MPSDGSGVYTLPAGYLAVTGETILASQHNPPLEDIEAGMTARLMRSGVAPMTGPLKIADGTVGAPSLAFNTAPTYGIYKTTNGIGASVNGAKVMEWVAGVTSFVDAGDTASANPLVLGTGNVFNVTGSTGFATIGTKGVGTVVWVRFNAALTITHHSTDLVLLTGANITTRAGDWAQFEEYATGDWRMVAYHRADGTALIATTPRGYIDGLTLSNGTDATNDIDIAAGVCRDSTTAVDIVIATALGKQLDANWAAGGTTGTPAGGRNSAAGIADGTYHVWAARTAASSAGDVYFHTSATAATVITALQAETGGADYIYARRIGSITRSTSIRLFVQDGDEFLLKTPLNSYSSTNPGTSAVTYTVVGVPTGVKMGALLDGYARFATTGNGIYRVFSSDETDAAVDATNMTGREATDDYSSFMLTIRTNTSAQAKFRFSVSAGSDAMNINCRGWIDSRGKDA